MTQNKFDYERMQGLFGCLCAERPPEDRLELPFDKLLRVAPLHQLLFERVRSRLEMLVRLRFLSFSDKPPPGAIGCGCNPAHR